MLVRWSKASGLHQGMWPYVFQSVSGVRETKYGLIYSFPPLFIVFDGEGQ